MSPPYAQRRRRLARALRAAGLDAMALNPGPSLRYFFGHAFFLGERPILGLVSAAGGTAFVAPQFEAEEIAALGVDHAALYDEDPTTWPHHTAQALAALDIPPTARIGIEPVHLRVLEWRLLEQAAPQAAFPDASQVVMALRSRKDEAELAALRRAVRIAEAAWQATLPMLRVGVTEREVAAELVVQLLRHGAEPDLPFGPIVAFGPHSASPHAQPGDTPLTLETPVLFDWGARVHGYASDMTRMVWFGTRPEPEFLAVAEVVARAVRAGLTAARVGSPAAAVDRAARQVITAAGYGPAFVHRTGHGLGLDVHEPPYLRDDNDQPLAAGMVFTVEPGVYLTGRWGVRIEEMVHLTPAGAERLTTLPYTVQMVAPQP